MKFIDRDITRILITLSAAVSLGCLNFDVANGEAGTINEAMGNGNDTACAICDIIMILSLSDILL